MCSLDCLELSADVEVSESRFGLLQVPNYTKTKRLGAPCDLISMVFPRLPKVRVAPNDALLSGPGLPSLYGALERHHGRRARSETA